MLEELTFMKVFGIPLIIYGGVFTFLLFIFTALMPVLNRKGITKFHPKWHPRMAYISLVSASIHGLLGVLSCI